MDPGQLNIGIHPDHPVEETVAFARSVEGGGFGGLWIADSQDLFRDCMVSTTAVALATASIPIGIGVTNPVLRHPSVLAGAAASLDELVPGRLTLGLGSGETAVQTAGQRPATIDQMEAALRACRDYLSGPWGGPPRPVALAMAATGPRALAVAGRLADTAYLKIGGDGRLLQWASEQVRLASEGAGRATRCTVTLLLPVGLGDTLEEAYREVAGFAAATAGAVHQAVPRDVIAAGVQDDLDAVAAMVRAARRNESYASWLDDPARIGELPRRVVDMFCIASDDPGEVAERLRALPVDRVVVPLLTGRRREQLARLRDVLAA
ncbi:MAG: LLM class flavin-dependent oxidoreductase [Actinomycetota bacterium]|nr:LLM class flavin-dependent oxidoreductase [Actinomycetota bacterium]MDA8047467.1 LLM class flavin-dependent oxidoreductase [Actinomycetota bacterium]